MMKASSDEALCSSSNGEGHWKIEMMIQLSKLTNIESCVVVAPPVIKKIKGAVEVGWKFCLNVHEH
jgi:hypothetical protein